MDLFPLSEPFRFVIWMVGISFVLSVLISLKPLMFLGETTRYAEHTVVLQVMMFVLLSRVGHWDALLVVCPDLFVGGVLGQYGKLSSSSTVTLEKMKRDLLPLIQGFDIEGNQDLLGRPLSGRCYFLRGRHRF